jgi:predicted TIM-barrel fold metal-dependent hydrolase
MLKFIDTHVHFWDLNQGINSWVNASSYLTLQKNFVLEDYLRGNPRPLGLITVEAADGSRTIDEVHWLGQSIVTNKHNIHVKHVAYIDLLQEPQQFIAGVERFSAYNFIVGFRQILSYSSLANYSPLNNDFTLDPHKLINLKQNLKVLKAKKYIFNCQMYPEQLIRIAEIIAEAGVQCIVDHCGLPFLATASTSKEWLKMLDIFKDTETYFKLSGFSINTNWPNLNEILQQLFNFLPVTKLLFASNYPVCEYSTLDPIREFLTNNGLIQHADPIFFQNAADLFFNN